MINFHKPTTAGFTAGILLIGVLGLSAPASAGPWWPRSRSPATAGFSGRVASWPGSRNYLLHLQQADC